jgi:hypothetical protein
LTQTSVAVKDHISPKNPFYDFSVSEHWDDVIFTCTHIHQVAMSTPGLWAHISASWDDIVIRQYLARAGFVKIMFE